MSFPLSVRIAEVDEGYPPGARRELPDEGAHEDARIAAIHIGVDLVAPVVPPTVSGAPFTASQL